MRPGIFVRSIFQDNGYAALLLLILCLMCIYPPLMESTTGLVVIDIYIAIVFIYGIWLAYGKKPLILYPLYAIIIIDILLDLFNMRGFYRSVSLVIGTLEFIILLVVLVVILLFVMREKRVSFNLICAACSTYLLMGLVWSILYYVIELLHPGSFSGIHKLKAHYSLQELVQLFSDFLYYSFSVLTTVSFGDILPVGRQVRAITNMEAIMGQLFLAILISRLVGIHISQKKIDENPEKSALS